MYSFLWQPMLATVPAAFCAPGGKKQLGWRRGDELAVLCPQVPDHCLVGCSLVKVGAQYHEKSGDSKQVARCA